jgi:hypothetical protein
MSICKMMMYNTPSNCNILYNFLFCLYWLLDNSLCLNHVSDLNRDHFSPLNRNSLFILSSDILHPLDRYLFISNYWDHLRSLYWYILSPPLLLILSPLMSHILYYSLWNYFLSLLCYILCSSLFYIVSPILRNVLNYCLRNIV